MLILKAIGIWAILLVVAIANGTFRVAVLNHRFGDLAAHQISCATGSALILLAAAALIPLLGRISTRGLLGIGLLWLALTIAFEFGFGHFIARHSWEELLADYGLFKGRLWTLVLAVTFLAPLLAARARPVSRR